MPVVEGLKIQMHVCGILCSFSLVYSIFFGYFLDIFEFQKWRVSKSTYNGEPLLYLYSISSNLPCSSSQPGPNCITLRYTRENKLNYYFILRTSIYYFLYFDVDTNFIQVKHSIQNWIPLPFC